MKTSRLLRSTSITSLLCAYCLFFSLNGAAQFHCLTGCSNGTRSSVQFDPLRAEIAFDTLFARVVQLETLLDSLTESGLVEDGVGEFVCGSSTLEFDGYHYRTVEINGRCWFAENLRSTHYADMSPIPTASTLQEWLALGEGGQVHYDNNPINFGSPYGRLYNWEAVADERGLCPTGWHVPLDIEMPGGDYESFLASPDDDLPWTGTNSSGLSILPGGRITSDGFQYGNIYGYLWTGSENSETIAQWRGYIGVYYSAGGEKTAGLSVRCIQNQVN